MRRCAQNSSVASEQRHREKEQNNSSCDHVLEMACVCTSHPLTLSALGPTAVEDYLISEQQDTPAFSVQDPFLINNAINRCCYACSKTLDCPTAVENKGRDKGRTSACTACDVQEPPAQTGGNKTSRCAGPAHQQKDVLGLSTKNVRRKTGATGSRDNTWT